MKKIPNINVHLCRKIVFMGSMCFCFDWFKIRWGKYSEADDTEKSFLSSGIDGINITTFSCRSCIPESLKKSGDSGECDKVHKKLFWSNPHTARCVVSSQMLGTRGYNLVSPASLFPSLPKANIQDLIMMLTRNQGLRITSSPYSLIQRGKREIQTSVLQENCPMCYSFHNVQSLSY